MPALKNTDFPLRPTGQWSAVYEGDGKWRVQGAVVSQTKVYYTYPHGPGEIIEIYHSTTWIHTDEKVELILWDGSPPIISTQTPSKAEPRPSPSYTPSTESESGDRINPFSKLINP